MNTEIAVENPPTNLSEQVDASPTNSPLDEVDDPWGIGGSCRKAWEERVVAAAKRHTNVQFELGDLLVEGDAFVTNGPVMPENAFDAYGQRIQVTLSQINNARMTDVYDVAEALTGLSRAYLKDLASTARRIPASVRTDALTWSHHREVANLLPDANEQTKREWLQRAVNEHLSVAGLKKRIAPKPIMPQLEESFVITVKLGTFETLKDIAAAQSLDGKQVTPQEVAAEMLNNLCASKEIQEQREIARADVEEARYQKRREVGLRVGFAYNPLRLER